MDIIAHRGFSGSYPENTMLSFEKAVENGAAAIELDVHLSKDGEVMIIHDEALSRTAGKDGFVFDYTRSELEKISAGKTKGDKFGFTPIPSLEEYLAMIKETDLYTNIELKTAPVYYPGIEEKTLELVSRFGLEDRILYSSFNWLSVLRVKEIDSTARIALLFDGLRLLNMGTLMSSMGVECYHPSLSILDDQVVSDMKAHGVKLNVWTVNDEEGMKRCIDWNIDGLITNEVLKAKELHRT